MKTQIKVMPDGFVWRVLTPAEARVLWKTNTFEIYTSIATVQSI